MPELMSYDEAARFLKVSPDFIRQMIDKGRLTPRHGDKLDPAQVEALADLMARLKQEGIATMVGAIDEQAPDDPISH